MNELVQSMIQSARAALKNSYAPYSNFHVSCCMTNEEGEQFTGVNVENSAYGLTTCAEASAISHLVSSGHKTIQHVVIMAENNKLCSPCGACRQRIYEFSTPETQIHLCDNQSVLKTLSIEELLPLAFRLNNTTGTNDV